MKPALVVMVAVGALATVAWAQEEEQGRGVARISVISGDVSVRRGDSGELVAAAINAPLVVADRVLCGPQSRAELQFDYANMIRIDENSEVRLAELEYQRYQVQVATGTVMFRVLRDSRADVELSTPSVSVRPVKRGSYRVTVREDGSSEITVRSGEVEIYTPRGAERLTAGRTMLARGSASDPEYQVVAAIRTDDWDRWNERRDHDLERTRSYQYVSSDIYGAEDLDGYGDWTYAPEYGWVWAPRVAYGWAPYRYGQWSWIDWYGWSWISYDPWGWAPYHYGRWFSYGNRWCWWPGGLHSRHYWSPALVGFFGWGHGGIGVGFGFGNVGWVPLAPHEPYYPWYGRRYYSGYRNSTYIDNSVHVVNNVNITNIYRNARVTNGVTAVNAGDFQRGRVGNVVRASDSDLRGAGMIRGQLPLAPDRQSLRLADRDVRSTAMPRTAPNERFFSRRQPAAVDRVAFDDQRRGVEQAARRTFGATRPADNVAGGRAANVDGRAGAAAGRVSNAEPGRTAEPATGFRRSETPAARSAEPAPRRTEPADRSGWRRFGDSGGRTADNAPARTVEPQRPAISNDGGRRAAEPAPSRRDSGNDSWRRFESSPRTQSPTPSRAEPAPSRRDSRDDSWRRYQGNPRAESPAPNRAEPLRISPPIVRERPASRGEDRGGTFYRAPESRPQMSAPAPSPRMSAPAPSPRMSAPAPSPRMSAPAPSPRMSAPAAPRGGGEGARGGGGGGRSEGRGGRSR